MIKFARPMIGEEERKRVANALCCDRLTEGPLVYEFEQRFGERFGGYAVAVSSCTAALHLAGLLWEPDDFWVPAMTHPATALAMEAAGHDIRFTDCDEDGICREGVNITVDFLGMKGQKTLMFEDAATALHHKFYADIACFSFYPAKQMTTGEGGMVLCRDKEAATEIKAMRAFGKPDFSRFGLNYRMSEMAAALGLVQLDRLPEFIEKRRVNEIALRTALGDLEVIGNNYALSVILPEGVDRDNFRNELYAKGIETSVYYPIPVPHTPYFGEKTSYPNAERISSRSVTLSIGPHLTPEDMTLQGIMVNELLLSEGVASSATILPFDLKKRATTSRS